MKRWSRGAELVNLARDDTDENEASTSKENAVAQSSSHTDGKGTSTSEENAVIQSSSYADVKGPSTSKENVVVPSSSYKDGKGASTSKINTTMPSLSPCKKFIIQKQQVVILDENTGKFILRDATAPEKKYISNDYHSILDEKTGQLRPVSPTSQSDSSQGDFSASDDTTDFKCSEYSSTSTDLHTSSKTLDETSGLITRKKAKKGQANYKNWFRNQLKRKRQKGKQYASIKRRKGEGIIGMELRGERKIKPTCVSAKCAQSKTRKCQELSEEDRAEIFRTFWDVLSWEQRKLYVNSMVVQKPVERQTKGVPSKRTHTLEYHLKVNGEMKAVCKKMFIGTLCLGEWSVTNWVKNGKNDICMVNKTPKVKRVKPINVKKVEHIKNFLNVVPKMPSHYCRKSTCKEYVDLDYATWMDLYKTFEKYMKDSNIADEEKASYKCFLSIVREMNLGLYKPKKDQCDLCYSYKNNNVEEEKYETHIQNKNRARQEKEFDKKRCLKGDVHLFTVDLQAVQNVPFISAGAQYFKLKLCVHQFTIYNEKDGSAMCYVWHEGEGGVDSNVFTSCIINFLEGLEDKNKPIIIFSDGCGYQNRNVTLSNALQHFAIKYNAEIYQKYLEVGHTQMSCDSVHSTIEMKKKRKELFVPADFVQVIKEARAENPYQVCYLSHEFFLNYGEAINYYKSIRPGKKPGDPCVVDLRTIKYTHSGINYKIKFDDDWTLLPQRFNRSSSIEVGRLYNQPLPIKKRKMEDLQSMKELLPKDYHSFYDTLIYEE